MKLKALTLSALAALACYACSTDRKTSGSEPAAISTQKTHEGDSTIYGLACDGCTDSVVVFLPNSGGDPDTFDIITAYQRRRIFGRPKTGDKLAIMVNPEDKREATMIIDLDDLKGSWCYRVMPTMRSMAAIPKRVQRRMPEHLSDSIRERFLVPREYGFKLKREYSASPIGLFPQHAAADETSPVEYPKQRLYNEWRVFNGKLILTVNAAKLMAGAGTEKTENDTAEIVLMMRDSLVLKFKDRTQGYYRKQDTAKSAR